MDAPLSPSRAVMAKIPDARLDAPVATPPGPIWQQSFSNPLWRKNGIIRHGTDSQGARQDRRDRLAVPRGPQGTLHGSGSMGGTSRVPFKQANLKKMKGTAEAGAETTRDGRNAYNTKGAINMPRI